MRRAAYRAGGMAAGGPAPGGGGPGNTVAYQGRTQGSPGLPSGLSVAPPYRVGKAPGAGGGHPFLDFSRPQTWRNAGALLAVAYVTGFHITIGGIRVRAPVPHGHAFALGIYIAAWVYLWKFGADVISAANADKPAAAALHQAF